MRVDELAVANIHALADEYEKTLVLYRGADTFENTRDFARWSLVVWSIAQWRFGQAWSGAYPRPLPVDLVD